jgi:hypothetical protein
MNYLSADHPNRPCSTTVGDKPGHLYSIDQINCTAIKDEIAGVKIKSGRMATTTKYAFTGTFQERAFQSGSNKWPCRKAGKDEGRQGASGTCKAKGNADESKSFDCMGTYTPPCSPILVEGTRLGPVRQRGGVFALLC